MMTLNQEIADYIIDTLAEVGSPLDEIRLFLRGSLPTGLIPQDLFPYIEVAVYQDDPDPDMEELTGNVLKQVYQGAIIINVLLTEFAGGDWFTPSGEERKGHVFSYTKVDEYAAAIISELGKCEHKDMGTLTDGNEQVWLFKLIGPRMYGLDRDARTNDWENRGLLPFTVETDRAGG
jgi:hypothetical protein